MNELFRDPVVVDIDSLKLQRRTNEVSKEDDIGQRMEDLRNVDMGNVQAPPSFDQLKGAIPDTVLELFDSVQNKTTVQIPPSDADNFEVHSYHTESSVSSKHGASSSRLSIFLDVQPNARFELRGGYALLIQWRIPRNRSFFSPQLTPRRKLPRYDAIPVAAREPARPIRLHEGAARRLGEAASSRSPRFRQRFNRERALPGSPRLLPRPLAGLRRTAIDVGGNVLRERRSKRTEQPDPHLYPREYPSQRTLRVFRRVRRGEARCRAFCQGCNARRTAESKRGKGETRRIHPANR